MNQEQIQPSEVTLIWSLIAAASDDEPDADRNGSDRSYFLRLLRRPADTVLLYQPKPALHRGASADLRCSLEGEY